ncbi:MAG: hypothetical protein JST19_05915 [Bacteroidetes bacterium]|nr:hypothetical protein [Bacteroidota bacterium]
MKDRPVLVLKYISAHRDAKFDSTLTEALNLDKFEVNEILFNLIHEELITDSNGVLRVTEKGAAYLGMPAK